MFAGSREEGTNMPNSLFISYRRESAAAYAGWIYELLVDRYGRSSVFRDTDSIHSGEHFPSLIAKTIASCDAVIVLIDPAWSDATDERGARRLDDAADWVRLEIETAFDKDVPVIPLLVHGAKPPARDMLPPSIRAIADLQAFSLRDDKLRDDLRLALDDGLPRPGGRKEYLGVAAQTREQRFVELVSMFRGK
jgi:hypothetical protein